ncbi:hypothetical protein U0070_018300, partial [Myodes glareolus]
FRYSPRPRVPLRAGRAALPAHGTRAQPPLPRGQGNQRHSPPRPPPRAGDSSSRSRSPARSS